MNNDIFSYILKSSEQLSVSRRILAHFIDLERSILLDLRLIGRRGVLLLMKLLLWDSTIWAAHRSRGEVICVGELRDRGGTVHNWLLNLIGLLI